MKKVGLIVLTVVAGCLIMGHSLVSAGSIDWLSQQSTDYLRMLSRNAALDGADIANYNPAATAFLEDGYYVQLGFYSLLKYYDIEYADTVYESDEPSPAVPFLYGILKQDHYAGFLSVTVPAGGGGLDYQDGIPFMKQNEAAVAAIAGVPASFVTWKGGNLKAYSMYLAATLGGAYAINDNLSASLSVRYIQASKEVEGESTYSIAGQYRTLSLDSELTAEGFGAVIGLDYKPNDQWNFGLRYESATELEFEADTSKNDFQMAHFNDGDKERRDLPAVLGLGTSFQYNEKLQFGLSAHYFFITQADDAEDTTNALGMSVVNSYDDDYDNGFEVMIGTEYLLLPNLHVSLGYQYTVVGGNEDTYRDFEFSNDSHFISGGGKWKAMDNLDVSLSAGKVWYLEEQDATGSVTYNKSVWVFGLSGEMKF
ncbi:outer membrane protein transport protein [bacterium]|nr:outer membrane protein transport protein [bacterium]